MHLTHKIALCPTAAHEDYFRRAAGTARFVWNWGLAACSRQRDAGRRPNPMDLKKAFNAIKYFEFPWLSEMHRDCHSQPFAHLQRTWTRFYEDVRAGKTPHEPRFKKKGRCTDSFYVANDHLTLKGKFVRIPKIGYVAMTEALRFEGKVLGATITRTAQRWFLAVQVEVSEIQGKRRRTGDGITGVDLGLRAAVTLSSGEAIEAPKPLRAVLRRLKIRGRSLSRKIEAAKQAAGFCRNARLPKGTRLKLSNSCKRSSAKLAIQHARVANLRADFTHKLTSRLCRENQAVVIEDLNVVGMLANNRLARAISDVGFGEIRRQLEYKSLRYGTQLVVADRYYPSSRLCSSCGWKNERLSLKDRDWRCSDCGTHHDRDINAALNLRWLATTTALPVASRPATANTTVGKVSPVVGEVTPVRYECGQQDTSGQEENSALIFALSRKQNYW